MKNILHLIFLFIGIQVTAQSLKSEDYSIAKTYSIYSNILEQEREIMIYLPEGFWGLDEQLASYPVTYVLDGESQFQNAVSTIDFISAAPFGNDLMPRTIVVGIPNTNRNRDLTPTNGMLGKDSTSLQVTGGGLKFLDFITEELIPYVDSLYSTNEHRTIIGHSLGGLIAFQALLEKRAYFNNYLSIDPGLGFDNESFFNRVVDSLRIADLENENLFVAVAETLPTFMKVQDIESDTSDFLKIITKSNMKFLDLANTEDWSINFSCMYYSEENHFSVPIPATYDGLKFFYKFYPYKEMMNYFHPVYQDKVDLVDNLKRHYEEISKELGFEVIPMESFLNSWAFGGAHSGRNDLALLLFDYSISLYPSSTSAYNTKGYFLQSLGDKKEAIKLFEKSLLIKQDKEILENLEALKKD